MYQLQGLSGAKPCCRREWRAAMLVDDARLAELLSMTDRREAAHDPLLRHLLQICETLMGEP